MDFNQLHNFTVIAELGSITKAAATLSVAQPALSRQIKKLEEELGISLFYRHGHGVSLTDEGRAFLEQATRLIADFHSLKRNAAGWSSQVKGSVSIGMPPTVARVIGADLVVLFKQKFPEASIELTEGLSGHIHALCSNFKGKLLQRAWTESLMALNSSLLVKSVKLKPVLVICCSCNS